MLLGCARERDRSPVEKSTITGLYPGNERIMSLTWDTPAKFLVFLPLAGITEDGGLTPRLARSWEHSPDHRTWTFHLRSDVRWHDGVPVTADDVKFTFDLWQHPEVLYISGLGASVAVLDDTTFTVTYARLGHEVEWVWGVYYPKHLLEGLDPAEVGSWEFWTHPVGNGPYRYVRHVPNTMLELEANPDYYRGKPAIDRVVLKFGGSDPLVELLSGNVDVVAYTDRADIPKLEADPRFEVYHHMWPGTPWVNAIFWNHESPLFGDARVRGALTRAIDRRELYRLLHLPDDLPVVDVLYTPRQYRDGELPEPIPYDPAGARELLEAAGWVDVNGDGVREREGREFRFTAAVPRSGTFAGPSLEAVAVYVQSQLREVGVRMEIGVRQYSLRAGDFEAALGRYNSELFSGDPHYLDGDIPIGYRNARVIALFDSARATMVPEEVDRLYAAMMPILLAEQPITTLYPESDAFVAHRRLRGLSSPYRSDPLVIMGELWLEDDN